MNSDQTPPAPGSTSAYQSPGRTVRCPSCHNPIRLTDDSTDEVLCPGCGSTFRVADTRLTDTATPTRRLGKFQLLERVGQGAFGAVWKARDTELDRVVALKIPHGGLLHSPEAGERFAREARAAAQLRHPGIVTVHEVVTLDGLPAIVSDFIDGLTLRDLLALRPLTFPESAELVAQLAEGLDYAHERGLVHRDIKPGNVMVERRHASEVGRPMVMDFGLALRDEVEVTLTLDGQVLGTPAYMSPEQAAGRGHRVDRRSDVYSLGVIFYELLCGELPFRGTKQVILHQVRHDEPRPPRSLNEKVPRDLETIALKAMAKEPERRYPTAGEFAADLRRFLRGEPIRARPVGRLERLGRWCRRNPALAITTALAAAALLAVTGLSIAFAVIKARANADLTQANSDLATANTDLGDALRKLGDSHEATLKANNEKDIASANLAVSLEEKQRQLSLMAFQRARALVEERELPGAMLWMGRALELAPPHSEDLERVIRVNLAEVRDELVTLKAVLPHGEEVTAVAFSPDGQTFLTAEGNLFHPGEVRLFETATGTLRKSLVKSQGSVEHLALSPDGKIAVTTGTIDRHPNFFNGTEHEAELWDVATGKRLGPALGHPFLIWSPCFSPDGKTLLTAWGSTERGEGRLYDVATGRLVGQPLAHNGSVWSAAFAPDGKKVLTGSQDGTARLWDGATARPLGSPVPHPGPVDRVAFSPDGTLFFTIDREPQPQLRLWRTADQKPVGQPIPCHDESAFSPDGKLVLAAGPDNTLRFWDVAGARAVGQPMPAATFPPAFSPDGKWLATGDVGGPAVRLWEVPSGRPVGGPLPHLDKITCVAFSPDGRSLLTGSIDRTVRLWRLPAGRLRETASVPDDPESHRSPDGRLAWRRAGATAVRLTETATGRTVGVLQHPYAVQRAHFSPDGKALLVCSWDALRQVGDARLWDTATAKQLGEPAELLHFAPRVEFSADGKAAAVASEDRQRKRAVVRLWQTADGKGRGLALSNGENPQIFFSPDGQRLAVSWHAPAVKSSQVVLWETATGKEVGPLRQPGFIQALAFSPDSLVVVTAAAQEAAVRLWDAATAEASGPPLTLPESAGRLVFSRDGKVLFTGGARFGPGSLSAWDVATRRQVGAMPRKGQQGEIVFSPDRTVLTVLTKRQLARAGGEGQADRDLVLMDATTGAVLGQPLEHKDAVTHALFSPDGRAVLTGSEDKTARLWEVPTGRPLTPPLAHEGPVSQLAFSPDGRTLLTVSDQRTVRLWSAATGQAVGQPLAHPDPVATASFSPDGRLVRTITGRREARFWDAATGAPLGLPVATVSAAVFPPDGAGLLARADDRHGLSWEPPPPVEGAAARVVCWAEALTGMELSPDGALARLGPAAYAGRRGRLENLGGPPYEPGHPDERERGWHRAAVLQAEKDQEWAAVLWHLERLGVGNDAGQRALRGRAHYELGHWARAADDFTAAIEGQAAGPEAWYQRGWARAYLNQSDEALKDFAKALEVQPGDEAVLLARHFVNARRGEWKSADADLGAVFQRIVQNPYHAQSGRWQEAINAYTRAVNAGLTDWWVWRGRAFAYRGLDRSSEAADDLSQALERRPDDWRLLLSRAVFFGELGQHDRAIADYSRALELKKDEASLWLNRAREYGLTRQWEKAAADYSKALDVQANNGPALAGRADAYANAEEWEKAAADYAKLTGQGANNPVLWHRLALLRLQLGDLAGYRAAAADMRKRFGRADRPDLANSVAWTGAVGPAAPAERDAAVQLAAGAVAATERAIYGTLEARNHTLYLNTLGAAYYRAGQFEAALASLDMAMRRNGGGTPADWLLAAMTLQRLGQPVAARLWLGRAVDWLKQSTPDKPKDAAFGGTLGWDTWLELQLLRREAEYLDENDKKALAELDKAVKDKPEDAAGWAERARFHKWHRRFEPAAADYSKAVDLRPKEAAWRSERGRVYGDLRQWDKAAADFLEVVGQKPTDAAARLEGANALAEDQQWDKAGEQYDKVLEQGNAPAVAWYYRALVSLGAGQEAEYRRFCARMLDAKVSGAPPAAVIVQTCRAAPDALTDFAPALKLAETMAAAEPGSYPVQRLKGHLLYRAGQFEAAVKQLDRALALRQGRPDLSYATDALYLAMAHQRLDHTKEAKDWLAKAGGVIDQAERDRPKAGVPASPADAWYNRMVLRRTRQEAEALVK